MTRPGHADPGVEIRRLEPSDRGELLRLRQSLWPDSTAEEVDDLVRRIDDEPTVWVAAERERLVAFAEVGQRTYAEGCDSSPVAYLEGIWVEARARRRGIALALVRHAEAAAREVGVSEFASDCALDNAESRAFHLAAGFMEVERIICFRRSIDD